MLVTAGPILPCSAIYIFYDRPHPAATIVRANIMFITLQNRVDFWNAQALIGLYVVTGVDLTDVRHFHTALCRGLFMNQQIFTSK